jgi:aerobic C4-dicarboxylate transport protein
VALLRKLYVQVLLGIAAGTVLGFANPGWGLAVKPLGDAFIALLRMLLVPIIFCTVVHGIASVRDISRLGRLGIKALIYFEVVSTIGLVIGWAVVTLFQPGAGLHVASSSTVESDVASASGAAVEFTITNFLLSIIPRTLLAALVSGEILQVLFVSTLIGIALSLSAPRDSVLLRVIEEAQTVVFRILGFVMRIAPLGAFGAMAAAVAANGNVTLLGLLKLVALFYATCIGFVILVLGVICRMAGLSLLAVLRIIREEIALVFGTASGEVAFPRLVQKLSRAGCDEAVVGFALPAGYSFNLDGTAIYLAMAVGFIAQATDMPFPVSDQVLILGVMLLTSKGGTAVAGGAFVKLAATMQSVRVLPLGGLPLLFSVDRLLAIAISVTNIIGNTVAVLVLARWENAFDRRAFEGFVKRE